MDDFDLDAARLLRLEQDVEALFEVCDLETRQQILGWFTPLVQLGQDPIKAFLRLQQSMRRIAGITVSDASTAPTSTPVPDDDEIKIEALLPARRATFWPYRPKLLPDELLSSWLWRVASGLGAPPKRFALDAIGTPPGDVDRHISDAGLDRLAFLSGQSRQQLLHGTLRADVPAQPKDRREQVQRALLGYGDLILNRDRGGRSRQQPIIQYCPACLRNSETAYLRRGWRFSLEVVCSDDGAILIDACWSCGAFLDPLAQTVPSASFLCVKCGAVLGNAPCLAIKDTIADQGVLYDEIHHLAFGIMNGGFGWLGQEYIEALSSGDLRGTNPTNAAERHNAVMLEAWRLRSRFHRPCRNRTRVAAASRGKTSRGSRKV